jgi:hypothetical protein
MCGELFAELMANGSNDAKTPNHQFLHFGTATLGSTSIRTLATLRISNTRGSFCGMASCSSTRRVAHLHSSLTNDTPVLETRS